MVKAKEFWNFICEELDYRFFSGVACEGLLPLLKTMSSDFMHYVPAANERIALSMTSGAYMGGFKGGILISDRFLTDLIGTLKDLNLKYKTPLLIIAYTEINETLPLDIPKVKLSRHNSDNYKKLIRKIVKKSEDKNVPALLTIEEGVL